MVIDPAGRSRWHIAQEDEMSDTETGMAVDLNEGGVVETAPAEKPKKEKAQPHACLCSTFLLFDPEDSDAEFRTECGATTMRNFAQGHDARLVSFLVSGHFDGYKIAQDQSGARVLFDNPGHAAASVSESLGVKADKAVENEQGKRAAKEQKAAEREASRAKKAQEKADAKAAKDAEKAAKKTEAKPPREVGAKVVKETVVDDGPIDPKPGDALIIKVGRGEYEADVEAGTGDLDGKLVVRYRNLQGEEEVRDMELVRVLRRA